MVLDPQMFAFLQKQWNDGIIMRPGMALEKLQTDPRSFLETYVIQQSFDSTSTRPIQAYISNHAPLKDGKLMTTRPGQILPFRRHKTEGFNITNLPVGASGHPFWAHNVPTFNAGTQPTWIKLDSSGPSLMLTAKLTGCTFIVRQSGPLDIEATHLQPTQQIDGFTLHDTQKAIAGQATYGRYRYDIADRSVKIIGVRRSGKWKIYAQKTDKDNLAIISVNRVWPPK